jgi:molecular chaperone GrpE (heat shock protein)
MAVEKPNDTPEETLQQSVAKSEEGVEQVELEALRVENEELIDTLQRVKAEFDNYRKRAAGGPRAAGAGGGAGRRGGIPTPAR